MTIYQKKISVGAFFKKGEDFKENDLIEIANEGKQVPGQYGIQDIFLIKLGDGREGNVSFNQTTMNGLIDAYGQDSLKWIGKKAKVVKVKMSVAGKFQDVYFFAHPDAELTENGFVLAGKDSKFSNVDIPIIDEGEEEEVNINEIPF